MFGFLRRQMQPAQEVLHGRYVQTEFFCSCWLGGCIAFAMGLHTSLRCRVTAYEHVANQTLLFQVAASTQHASAHLEYTIHLQEGNQTQPKACAISFQLKRDRQAETEGEGGGEQEREVYTGKTIC